MIPLIRVILGALYLFGDGYCVRPEVIDEKDLANKTVQISYNMYEMIRLMPESVYPASGGVIVSPISVIAPLGLIEMISTGHAKEQLAGFLKLNPAQILDISPFHEELVLRKNITLLSFSNTFVQQGLNLSSKFTDINERLFGGEADIVNFHFPEIAANAINDWVSNKSAGALKDVAEPGWINHNTEVMMVNVLYFKAAWKYQFNEDTIFKMFFGDSTLNFKVLKYMYQIDELDYTNCPELNADIVRLPFSDEDFEFILINPEEFQIGYVLNVTDKLREKPELLEEALKKTSPRLIEVALPKVKISTVIDVKKALEALGVTNMFDSRLANLEEMFQDGYPGHISKIMQKVEIELDIKGASVGTGILPDDQALLEAGNLRVLQIYATRPFVFQIRFKELPMFLGSYEGITRV